jgi:Raf kinase inhibitor-like YbhB/YbcL family protein
MWQAKGKGDGHVGRVPPGGGRSRITRGGILAGIAVLLSGCGFSSGSSSLTPDAPSSMTVSSAAFGQGVLPGRYTCHGARTSPPLNWSGAPSGTKSYAIVVDDAAAPITPYIYWIVFDIPPATTDVQDGQLPPGARQANNSTGRLGYAAPCPDAPGHGYRFTVYALGSTLNLPNGASTLSAWKAIANTSIARGRIPVRANP